VPGLAVVGTDTGVGKTVLSCALLAAMTAAGKRVIAHKPVVTGLTDVHAGGWPADHELLASVSDSLPERVAPLRYGPAVSPQLAAEMAGERLEPDQLLAAVPDARGEVLVLEGVGGLLTPFADGFSVRELVARLALPVLIAARPGLGTINHTLLTIEAARAARLDVRAVVLTPWPSEPSLLERSNRDTIAREASVEVAALAPVEAPERELLARAGAALPWKRWLESAPLGTPAQR
jgi:dethiobiotin synthetase